MLKSQYCVLAVRTESKDLTDLGECPYDQVRSATLALSLSFIALIVAAAA